VVVGGLGPGFEEKCEFIRESMRAQTILPFVETLTNPAQLVRHISDHPHPPLHPHSANALYA
jgi:hypothetical protein